jgi:intracellular septation protein
MGLTFAFILIQGLYISRYTQQIDSEETTAEATQTVDIKKD